MKTWTPWLVIVVMLGGLLYVVDMNRQARAVLKAKLDKADEANAELTLRIKDLDAHVGQIEAARIADAQLAAKREAVFLAELAKVRTATPQQLVDDGSRLLRATDITLSANGQFVTMGLETWRGAVSIMLNEEEYRLHREPAWMLQAKGYADTIALLKEQAIAYGEQVKGLGGTVKDLSKALGHERRASTFEKALWGAAGAGLGYILGSVAK